MYGQTTQNNGSWEEKWQKIQQKTPGYKSCKKIKNPKMNKNGDKNRRCTWDSKKLPKEKTQSIIQEK